LKIDLRQHWLTRENEVVLIAGKTGNERFPWKVMRMDGTYYTVDDDGKRLVNKEDDDDLKECLY
jgi:hypothetical protein